MVIEYHNKNDEDKNDLKAAKENDFSLILSMATGTGKTITSIKILKEFHFLIKLHKRIRGKK